MYPVDKQNLDGDLADRWAGQHLTTFDLVVLPTWRLVVGGRLAAADVVTLRPLEPSSRPGHSEGLMALDTAA